MINRLHLQSAIVVSTRRGLGPEAMAECSCQLNHNRDSDPEQDTRQLDLALESAPCKSGLPLTRPLGLASKHLPTSGRRIIHDLANGFFDTLCSWLELSGPEQERCNCRPYRSFVHSFHFRIHWCEPHTSRRWAFDDQDSRREGMGVASMRPRQILLTGGFLFFVICVFSLLRLSPTGTSIPSAGSFSSYTGVGQHDHGLTRPPPPPPPEPFNPQPKPAPAGSHPMWHLITAAERELEETKARQSKTLEQAVAEYRRRYRIPPPPNFDKWFAFAQAKGVQLIDEFDMIHDSLTPFWGLKPATIRQRAKEALGFDNALLGISIRGGKTTHVQGGGEWQREATVGMMGKFIEWLPSMDLCFNLHDEPRVTVPHDDLAKLVKRGLEISMPRAYLNQKPRNEFTKPTTGLTSGHGFEESKLTRFNVFAHQPTWTHSRLSCPPDSPARAIEEDEKRDDLSKYGLGELGFVYNVTAMSDICNSPSLSSNFGFFDRPNAYNIVLDLFPIFSQSKMSSYSDILYPSPWYWYEKVSYDEKKDSMWDAKEDKLYWRGSTTGGFSRNGGWRRQHRQRFVQKINAGEGAKILVNKGNEADQHWEPKIVNRGDYKEIMDVYFSHIGQCDPGDCDAQKEFFTIKGHAEQHDAWKYKYLLDIDGNAFSGRFYAFLRSRSLIFKWAIFREWHLEWLKPWAHYIPLSLQGDDWLEAVRFFGDGLLGKKEAERLANQQRDWANKVLRHEDMEVWFFRLLLEYAAFPPP
ncbi:Beta-1,2-xylosyltransferase 1-like protein 4 [Seiridium cupressi]